MATTTSTRPPAASRLPRTRESRPLILGLAILLIVGGALASAWLAVQAGHRSYFISVDQEVSQGAQITSDDLTRVSLPENFSGAIPTDKRDTVVGQTATTRLLPGTVLIPSMLSKKSGLKEGQTQLTLPVDNTPFVRGLQPGAQMALDIGTGDQGSRQAILAELVSVGRSKQGGALSGGTDDSVPIVVTIDVSCLSAVSQAIEDKSVTPALVGSSGGSAVRSTCEG
jgi:hypothetical protein